MTHVQYPHAAALFPSPAFSPVAVVPPNATWVLVGGQNAVSSSGKVVGQGDLQAQAEQVRINVEAALQAGGCSWRDVVKVQVHLMAGEDPRQAFGAFMPALAGRPHPPLVGVFLVAALANPAFLLEVAVDAVRP